jgi:hypothetical protein
MENIQAPRTSWQLKVFPLFSMLGWIFVSLALVIGLVVLSSTAQSYWGANAKIVRDSAEAGSALLGQLQILNVTPRWLEPLLFVGVASFMLGIALEFSAIPALLKNRGKVMKICFPLIAEQKPE